ncbi:MAG: hypothetical protein WC209_06600 [Ignavibacteriaceae bacterium]|jgi:hypothetical protein
MKTISVLFTVIFISLLISACKDPKTGIVIPENVEKYPTMLNTEWEYETASYVAKYDKNGNLGADSLIWQISRSVVKIISVNDSIYGEKNLVQFGSNSNQGYITKKWYRNGEKSFELIAYTGFDYDNVLPKARKSYSLEYLKYLTYNLTPDGALIPTKDSIFQTRRTVLEFPLTIGKSWDIYLPIGWKITRTILGKKQFSYQNTIVECFDIKSLYNRGDGPDYQTDAHDYISLEYGLVKREAIIDSIEITSEQNPYGTGEFLRYRSTSTLVRKSN